VSSGRELESEGGRAESEGEGLGASGRLRGRPGGVEATRRSRRWQGVVGALATQLSVLLAGGR